MDPGLISAFWCVAAAIQTLSLDATNYKNPVVVEGRLDLLSSLLWLHTHARDLTLALSSASEDQQCHLAIALRLDYSKDSDGKTGGINLPALWQQSISPHRLFFS
jgi:hypothetical protein